MRIRKILSLVLAVAMLTTVALAIPAIPVTEPGDILPSGELKMESTMVGLSGELNAKNYTLSKLKFEYGKSLVEEVVLAPEEGDDSLKIVLKPNYTIDKPQKLAFSFELKGKGDYRSEKFSFDLTEGEREPLTANYGLVEVLIDEDQEVDIMSDEALSCLYGSLVGRTAKMTGYEPEGDVYWVCKFVSELDPDDQALWPQPMALAEGDPEPEDNTIKGSPYGTLDFSNDALKAAEKGQGLSGL